VSTGEPGEGTAEQEEGQDVRRVRLNPVETLGMVRDLPESSISEVDAPVDEDDVGANYTLLGPVGKGAMGHIHVVEEHDLGRHVALKRLLPEVVGEEEVLGRFYREAQITAQLEHPSIVPVYRLEQLDGDNLAYTMKLVRGETLLDYVRGCREAIKAGETLDAQRQLSARVRVLIKVCEAIAFAHERGVMHRDLKPANIMIGPHGEVYVMDWGIARHFDEEPETAVAAADLARLESNLHVDQTASGVILGTPAYMSPEQASGRMELLGAASDQFALGLLLQEMGTLRRAVVGENIEEVMLAACDARRRPIEPLKGAQPVPRELCAIIDRATEFRIEDRYPDVQALIDDLHRFLDGEAVAAAPDNLTQKAARLLAQHRQTTLLVVVGLLVVFFASTSANLVHNARQKDAAAAREARLGVLLNQTSGHVHSIDQRLLVYEGLVQSLAAAAVQTLVHSGSGEPYYLASNIDQGQSPPDFAFAEAYGKELSATYAAFVLADGVEEDPLQLAGLAPLRHTMRRLFLRAGGHAGLSPDEAGTRIRARQLPLLWTYVGLEEGVHVSFPGKGGYPDGYDPRLRPWYSNTRFTLGPQWLAPYEDAQGMGLVVPCTMALYDGEGAFRGVAGVELTLDTVVQEFLSMEREGVEQTWLVDAAGGVVIASSDAPAPKVPHTAGYREEGGGRLLVHYPLSSLDWTFVARVASGAE
jgi:eukaryotic-like serine/threonine-protein kinase